MFIIFYMTENKCLSNEYAVKTNEFVCLVCFHWKHGLLNTQAYTVSYNRISTFVSYNCSVRI